MTEDEAKTKWCPMVRIDNGPNGIGVNRDLGAGIVVSENTYCIASECMWWVWDRTPENCQTYIEESGEDQPWNVPKGHCGAVR